MEDESAEVDEESKARTGSLTRRKHAWDDVKGGWSGQRKGSRSEDGGGGGAWRESIEAKCQGAARWMVERVDTNKGTEENPKVRCFPVARNLCGADKDREDRSRGKIVLAATPHW